MNRRRNVELMVGLGLMLGPLAYALSLSQPAEAPACEPPGQVLRVESVEICSAPPAPPPALVPEPEPEPEPPARAIPEDPEPATFLFVHSGRVVLST